MRADKDMVGSEVGQSKEMIVLLPVDTWGTIVIGKTKNEGNDTKTLIV